MGKYHDNLYQVLDELLDHCDKLFDDGIPFDLRLYYRKINRALDYIYRSESGIRLPNKTGRPLGCLDSVPRKRKEK